MSREYVVIYKDVEQISPDDFRSIDRVMKVTDETTVKEIREWQILYSMPYAEGERRDIIKLNTVQLTQL